MATKSTEIITGDAVQALAEQQLEINRRFRRAFRAHDATDANSNSYSLPDIVTDFEGEFVEIPEGSDYPRAGLTYGENQAVYTKYGFEAPVTDEAADDSAVDIEADIMEQMAREEARRLDAIAFNILDNNLNAAGPIGDATGDMTWDEIVTARQQLFGDGFTPDGMELYLSPDAAGDLLVEFQGQQFVPSAQMGDEVRAGQIGQVGGIPVFETNTGDLGDGEGILVDTNRYGWESTRWDTEVTEYREESNDQTVYKVRNRKDWVPTTPSAGIRITG